MKRIIIIVMVLLSANGFSQRGYERGYGGMTTQPNNEDRKEEFEENNAKLREESLENMMSYLNKELNLNELQSIAIKQIYIDSNKKQGIIFKKEEISQDEKMEALKSLSESTEKKVLDLLDAQQKEKFVIVKAELMKGIKKEKPKKEKKKKEKKEE